MKLKFTALIFMVICVLLFSMLISCNDKAPSEDKVTVTFNSNGGSTVDSQEVTIGDYIDEPTTPIREGYTFEGWYLGDKKWDFFGSINKDVTLVAKWSIIEYSITYVDGLCDLSSYTVEDEIYLQNHTALSSQNYTYICGWYSDKELTKPFTKIEKGSTGDLTLYAKTGFTPILYRVSSDKAYMIVTGCHNDATDIVIPSTFGNRPVLAIDENAFTYNRMLKSIVIEEGLTTIGENAFSGSYIESITLPQTLTTISRAAFANSSLTSIDIPDSVTYLGDNAFLNCSFLTHATLGRGISVIPSSLFANCDTLTSVDLRGNITSIYQEAFRYCSSLNKIYLGGSRLERIEAKAFSGCNSLKAVIIPNSVTYIGMSAFGYGNSSDVEDNEAITIYCETDRIPRGWNSYWCSPKCNVVLLFERGGKTDIYEPSNNEPWIDDIPEKLEDIIEQ